MQLFKWKKFSATGFDALRFGRIRMWIRILFWSVFAAPVGWAQRGDKPGEAQPPPAALTIPPAPALTPEAALKTIKVPPGFHVELVASEPLVESPIALTFDPDGRLWVVEMPAYMRDPDGHGEDHATGRIVVLEDADGDGRMDKRTVFLEGLVMPRALALVRDGILVAEPPKLWFCRDTDGDGKCDEKTVVATDYGNRLNPEHNANGLLYALDNWIYSANYTARFRADEDDWQRQPTIFRGQWGITEDDYGRLFYNSNSDQLRGDLVPSPYLLRNPHYRGAAGANVQIAGDQRVWPIRVNPGVNRGYQKGQLRSNGTLATYTAACGPVIYRGDNFPGEFYGNAFVCEPAGNLVRRNILTERNVAITATNAYPEAEFLASTDERFRPVNLYTGPDGALYLVDMYRGIIEHRIYLTTYLRNQALSRGLEAPLDLGRIYRVVHDGSPLGPRPRLTRESSAQLVKHLSHPNGWWRDTAQRLLVERRNPAVLPALRTLAISGREPLGRLHALWTLDGMAALDAATAVAALSDEQPKIRAAAIRLSESFLKTAARTAIVAQLLRHVGDPSADVQLQLTLTLGEVKGPEAEQAAASILRGAAGNLYLRDAALTGLNGRELEFLELLLADPGWNEKAPGREALLRGLSQCVFTEHQAERVSRLLELAAAQAGIGHWRQLALLDGIVSTVGPTSKMKGAPRGQPVRFASEPPGLLALEKLGSRDVRARVGRMQDLLVWPGKPGVSPEPKVTPLTAAQQQRFSAGKELFAISCVACHQPHGLGQEGLAPPLVDSEWVLGPEPRLVRIVLAGVHGRLRVEGRIYELEMPALAVFNDEQIAGILTYIRREWGHTASPVEPATVAGIRAETLKHDEAWTESELLQIP